MILEMLFSEIHFLISGKIIFGITGLGCNQKYFKEFQNQSPVDLD
jgi:hypothetical protein